MRMLQAVIADKVRRSLVRATRTAPLDTPKCLCMAPQEATLLEHEQQFHGDARIHQMTMYINDIHRALGSVPKSISLVQSVTDVMTELRSLRQEVAQYRAEKDEQS